MSGGRVGFIKNGSWVRYSGFDCGAGATNFMIETAGTSSGGSIELRLGATNGALIGSVSVTSTGSNTNFQWRSTALSPQPAGTNHLFLRFLGTGSGFLFDVRSFLLSGPASFVPKAAGVSFRSVQFDLESAPGGAPILANGEVLEAVADQSWVAYTNFNFGENANRFSIEAATPFAGGRIQLRLGSPNGSLVGTADVRHTGSDVHYQDFDCVLSPAVSGTNHLYLKFVGGAGGNLFKVRRFLVSREFPALGSSLGADEDADGVPALLEYATGMHPQSKDALPFDLKRSTNAPAAEFQIQVRAESGLATQLLVSASLSGGSWQPVTLLYTNGSWQTDNAEITVGEVISQGNGLFSVRLQNGRTDQQLFARLAASKAEGRLHVYPPVPGFSMTNNWAQLTKDQWTESPYYTYGVQKLSQLNHTNFALATNWETPFAFFTRCVDYSTATNAFFDSYIGGWSHTYCNFELDPHTPIAIKIHRRTQTEMNSLGIVSQAAKGPITNAVAYPTRKVDSCQIINGDVYVVMSNPALIAVDIDRQMDGRDAPRNLPTGFGASTFPFRYESNATHAVTIFANPFIEDKPNTNDTANVRVVQPGQKPPTNFTQSVLYFAPGVHKLSVDTNGNEREWIDADRITPISGKSYYIPGDAVVYGNFSDGADQALSQNIRIFGHGTICGAKIPHEQDFAVPNSVDGKRLWMLGCDESENVVFEGLTLANPPGHTVAIVADNDRAYAPNFVKWCKSISWRVNNDGMTAQGNSYIEDSFLRHQDDGSYLRGMAIRRTTYWTDVNGHPFRCSFINSDRDASYPSSLPKHLIVEDCDVLYARAVFTTSGTAGADRNGIIAQWAGANATYADGTENTAQHIIFRNFTVSDPRPQKMLFAFHGAFPSENENKVGDWRGLRFENVDYQHANTWGWPNKLMGDADTQLKYWTFKNVRINGALLDAALLANPAVFTTNNVSDMIFEP
ncbi:MAG: carbohydrate-binding protein [Verrucomicrobiota bacterium]